MLTSNVWCSRKSFSFSQSSKLQSFSSLHIHHIRQIKIIFSTSLHFCWLSSQTFQQQIKTINHSDITKFKLKTLKTGCHKALTTSQWTNKWTTVSQILLHIQNWFITVTHRLLGLSNVRISPNAASPLPKQRMSLSRELYSKYSSIGNENFHGENTH